MNKRVVIIGLVVILLAIGVSVLLAGGQRNESASVENVIVTETASPGSSGSPASSPGIQARLTSNGLEPAEIRVPAGGKITFVHEVAAEISSDPHPVHTSNSELNLPETEAGKTITATFTEKGQYGIHNHQRPSQKGTVIVE